MRGSLKESPLDYLELITVDEIILAISLYRRARPSNKYRPCQRNNILLLYMCLYVRIDNHQKIDVLRTMCGMN